MKVFVQDRNGKPLDPTAPVRARILLKRGRAEVVQREPFTIRIVDREGGYTKNTVLGIDAGYSQIGFSAVTEKEELIAGVVKLRNDIPKKLEQRKSYRRCRRCRNTRYRKPRFNNRKRTKGWLAPSIRQKKDAHIRLIKKIREILPVTKTIVEVATFDTQKMQNPEISGMEYQQGTLQGYQVREYLLEKFGRKCVYCGAEDVPLQVEHIIPKARGGTSRVSNLTIACEKCNQKKGNKTAEEFGYPEVQKQGRESLKATAFMNQVRWKIVNKLNCDYTYGYITKKDRIELNLEKSHVNDAFVIANGDNQVRSKPFELSFRRRNNRAIQTNRKGYGRSIRRKRYHLQPGDLVRKEGILCQVKGMFNYGKWVRLANPFGDIVNSNVRKVELVKYGKGLSFT
ncbi:MAG: HNH endonuclease [Deltaproteobacteria bacterium]|nr:HNH endonuclease [Deltaproteobacteria bacterium]